LPAAPPTTSPTTTMTRLFALKCPLLLAAYPVVNPRSERLISVYGQPRRVAERALAMICRFVRILVEKSRKTKSLPLERKCGYQGSGDPCGGTFQASDEL
jgi:hypothetical protein